MNRPHPSHSQQGIVLLVALVFLLVITLLAVSSVRDSALENRVMARDLEHQRLFNAAEAGLRDAERRIAQAPAPLSACGTAPCLQGIATNNAVDFAHATAYRGAAAPTGLDARVRWYIRQIPLTSRQPVNAHYGEAAKSPDSAYYEVSSQAFFPQTSLPTLNSHCSAEAVCLRSVVARTFVEGQP